MFCCAKKVCSIMGRLIIFFAAMGSSPWGTVKETGGTIARGILALGWFKSRIRDKIFSQASQEHLLEPLFHHILQKVKDLG
jgi:hypothetical protein